MKSSRIVAMIAVCAVLLGAMQGCVAAKTAGKTVVKGTKTVVKTTGKAVKKTGKAVKNAVD